MKKSVPLSASFVLKSKNKKLGDIAATYASISGTCPKTCALRNNGCYAGLGNVGVHVMRYDAVARLHKKSSYRIAREEARLIMGAIRNGNIQGRPLRLHVSGDARTPDGAKALARAAHAWHDAGGGPAFGFTHSWKEIARKDFGQISILASVENLTDARKAMRRGYSPAVIVSEFPNGKRAFRVGKNKDIKLIPCPAQTGAAENCKQCRLCMNDGTLLKQNAGIAFEAHGAAKKKAKQVALRVL